jgi:type IV pilus assembly protein PilF
MILQSANPTRHPIARPALLAAAAFALLLAACASKEPAPPREPEPPPPPPKATEVSPAKRAQIHTDLGAGYYERGQMEVALDELNEAVKIDPNIAKTYNIYGLVYTMLREDAKAEQNFRRAMSLAPNDPDIRANWGWYLCTHDQMRESLPEFELAIRDPLYKTPDVALINAGRCAATIGDASRAEAYYRRALQVSPNNANAAFGLATLKFKEGRYEEARGFMRIVNLQSGPSSESLYLGMCVERHLGDRASEASYISQLRNRYPDSPETKALGKGLCE